MRSMRYALPLAALLALPLAGQAQTLSAEKLSQALGTSGLQLKAVPKRRPEQLHLDYELNDSSGDSKAFVITAPPSYFAEWQKMPGFEPLPGVGLEGFARPSMDQVCGRSARTAACVTLMPMAFPKGKKPTLQQMKAALATVL